MICQGRVVGILDVYSFGEVHRYTERDKRLIRGFASQAAAVVHNDLLYRRSQALAEINRLLSGTYDLKAMLDLILAKVLRLIGTDIGWLYLLDRRDNRLKVHAYRGMSAAQVHKARKLGQGVTGWVAEHGEAQLVPDVSKDERYIAARRKDIRSEIVVPLKREDVVLGVLAVKSTYLEAFTEDDLALLSTFATQAALAVERDKLAQHLQEVSRLTLTADPDELADYVAGAVHDLTSLSVALWLMDEKEGVLRIRAHRGLRKAYARSALTPTDGTITAEGFREKRLLWRRDVQDDAGKIKFYHLDEARRQDWHFFISVPLLGRDGQPFGSLSLYGPRAQDCSQSLQTLVWTFANQAAVAFENTELLRRERNLRRQAETLREVSGTIGSKEELNRITGRILDELAEVVEYKTASLQLIRGDYRSLLAGRGFDTETANRYLMRPITKDPLIRRLLQNREPLVLPYPAQDPDWGDMSDTSLIQSWAGVPLIYSREVVGILTVDHDQPGFYREELSESLFEFANRVAVDIRNARVFDSAQRRIRDLEIINNIVEMVGTKLETDELLQAIVSQIAQRLECTHCTIFFPEKESSKTFLVPRASYGARAALIWDRRFRSDAELVEGLVGWVYQHGQSLVLGNAKEDPRFAPAREQQDKPRSMLVIPIKVGDQTIGVISADQDEYGWFGESECSLVEALARQTGVAVQRAIGLDLLREISDRMSRADRVDDILQHIVEGAIELTNTSAGVIYLLSDDGRFVLKSFEHPADFHHPPPRMKEGGITHWIFKTGQREIIEDIQGEPGPTIRGGVRVNEAIYDRVQSMIGEPLKLGNKVLGVLFLNDKETHRFTDTEVSLLSTLAGQAAIAIENARLHAERDALYQTSLDIIAQLDRDLLLRTVVERATGLLEARGGQHLAGGFLLYHHDAGTVEIVAQYRLGEPFEGISFRFGEGAAGRVAKKQAPLIVDDYPAWDGRLKRFDNEPWKGQLKSLVEVPCTWKDEVIGVLAVSDATGTRLFDQHDVELLKRLTSQASIAIENARLFSQLDAEKKERVEAIREIGFGITAGLNLEAIFNNLLSKTLRLIGEASVGEIWLLDETSGKLKAKAGQGDVDALAPEEVGLGEGIVGLVASSKEPYMTGQVDEDPQFKRRLARTQSEMAVPLLRGEHLIGVLNVEHSEPNAFVPEDAPLLEAIASQVVIALENARLFQETSDKAQTLGRLHKVGQSILGLPESDQALQDLLTQVAHYALAELKANVVDLYQYDQDNDDFILPPISVGQHTSPTWIPPIEIFPDSLPAQIVRDKQPLYVRNSQQEASLTQPFPVRVSALPRFVIREQIVSTAGIPLVAHNKIVGVMFVNFRSLQEFASDQRELIEVFGHQAAIAIQNARLVEQLKRRIKELEVLTEIGCTISSLGVDQILDLVYEKMGEIMDLSDAQVQFAFYDETRDEVSFPLAVEQDDGRTIDIVSWKERQGAYRQARFYCELNPDILEQGTLPEVLQEEFERHSIIFAKDDAVVTRCKDDLWLIEDSSQRYFVGDDEVLAVFDPVGEPLFYTRLEFHQDVQSLQDAEKTIPSKPLEKKFEEHGLRLSNDVTVTRNESEDSWVLDSADRRYTIGQAKKLRVYPYAEVIVEQFVPRARREKPGLNEYVIRSQESLLIVENFEQEAEAKGIRVWPTFGRKDRPTDSWLGVPMMVSGRVTGVISIQSLEKQHAFDQEHVQVLTAIANQAAVAIENARLYHSIEQLNQQQQQIITDLESAQSEIADKERALVLTSVAADFVHKMNNLAGTIPNWVSLAKRLLIQELGEDKRMLYYLEKISEDARFLLQEARRLRDPLPKPEEVPVQDLVNSIIEQMELIASPDIDFVVRGELGQKRVWAVKPQLSDAILNVIDNAVKAISSVGEVSVRMSTESESGTDYIRLDIADTGCGIPAEKLATVFDLGATYRSNGEGMGYGLWRARNILEGLNGSISAVSAVGRGSTFTIKLPATTGNEVTRLEEHQ